MIHIVHHTKKIIACMCVCVWLLNLATTVRSYACWMTTSPARPISDDAKMAIKSRSWDMGSIFFATEPGSSETTPAQLGHHDANQDVSFKKCYLLPDKAYNL